MSKSYISIVVPVFNEKENIEHLLSLITDSMAEYNWEVLFVDDSSADGTTEICHELSQKDPRIKLILRLRDRGLAKATIQGMLSARGDILCVMDGDGQHPPQMLCSMIDTLESEQLDLVSASRKLNDGSISFNALPTLRVRLSAIGNAVSSFVIGRKLTDPLTGFFVIRRSCFLKVARRLQDPGFKLLLDILHSDKNLRHAELPFDFGVRHSGISKLDSYVLWQFITYILSKMTLGIVPARLISFLLVGSTGLVVHFTALYSVLNSSLSFPISQFIATTVAATSNFLLNNVLTFRDRRLRGASMFIGYLKFIAVSSVGIFANVSVASLTYERLIHVIFFATLAGIAIDTIWKFVIARWFIWR